MNRPQGRALRRHHQTAEYQQHEHHRNQPPELSLPEKPISSPAMPNRCLNPSVNFIAHSSLSSRYQALLLEKPANRRRQSMASGRPMTVVVKMQRLALPAAAARNGGRQRHARHAMLRTPGLHPMLRAVEIPLSVLHVRMRRHDLLPPLRIDLITRRTTPRSRAVPAGTHRAAVGAAAPGPIPRLLPLRLYRPWRTRRNRPGCRPAAASSAPPPLQPPVRDQYLRQLRMAQQQ